MKSFSEYTEEKKFWEKDKKKIDPHATVRKLEKTRVSLINHTRRGGRNGSRRGQELMDRYNDHRENLRDHDGEHRTRHWDNFCKKHGYHPSHDGGDYFA